MKTELLQWMAHNPSLRTSSRCLIAVKPRSVFIATRRPCNAMPGAASFLPTTSTIAGTSALQSWTPGSVHRYIRPAIRAVRTRRNPNVQAVTVSVWLDTKETAQTRTRCLGLDLSVQTSRREAKGEFSHRGNDNSISLGSRSLESDRKSAYFR